MLLHDLTSPSACVSHLCKSWKLLRAMNRRRSRKLKEYPDLCLLSFLALHVLLLTFKGWEYHGVPINHYQRSHILKVNHLYNFLWWNQKEGSVWIRAEDGSPYRVCSFPYNSLFQKTQCSASVKIWIYLPREDTILDIYGSLKCQATVLINIG